MKSEYPVVEGPYLRDILDAPQALRNTLASLDNNSVPIGKIAVNLAGGNYSRIVLTGMGGSYQVLHPINQKLISAGFTSLMAETSELLGALRPLLDSRTLLMVVSQSGRSAEIVRLLEEVKDRVMTIGITNTADSPLALKPNAVILLRAGEESSVSCKTTVTSLLALEWAGAILCCNDLSQTQRDLERAAPAVEEYLSRWREHVQTLYRELRGVRHLFVTGRGSSLAAAGIGGMIMKEAAHFHSESMSSALLRHGPFEMLGEECFVLVFEGDPAVAEMNRRLVKNVRQTGARAALVSENAQVNALRLPKVPPSVRPIVEMLPVQMASLALAALAGREAGKFERITKITTVE